MTSLDWQDWFERAWAEREETLYPRLFGPSHQGIFVLEHDLFAKVFRQGSVDPRWLMHGVIEFSPTHDRPSWLYVSSGLSNAWEADSPQQESVSGLGCEFIFQTPAQSRWAIVLLQRMVAFQLLLAAGRFPGKGLLAIGDRIPLRSPIDGEDSQLTWVLLTSSQDFSGSHEIPSGQFEFISFVGITGDEADFARANDNEELFRMLRSDSASSVTNPGRKSVLA